MGDISKLTLEQTAPDSFMQAEQASAIRDLAAQAHFRPALGAPPPYDITLSLEDHRLVIRMKDADGAEMQSHILALKPYRRLIQDYFMMIESYEQARRSATPEKLEAIDMGRRGLHNEGAALFQERLAGKIDMDHETARRFFTLVCVLHKAHLRGMG